MLLHKVVLHTQMNSLFYVLLVFFKTPWWWSWVR